MKKLNRSRFLDGLAPSHPQISDDSPGGETDRGSVDYLSFCGNSDLFSRPTAPVADRNLPKEELKRQAAFYRS